MESINNSPSRKRQRLLVPSVDSNLNIERELSRLSDLSVYDINREISSDIDSEQLSSPSNAHPHNSTISDNNNNHSIDDGIPTNALDTNNLQESPVEIIKSTIAKIAILDGKFFAVDLSRSTDKNILAKCQFCPGEKFY